MRNPHTCTHTHTQIGHIVSQCTSVHLSVGPTKHQKVILVSAPLRNATKRYIEMKNDDYIVNGKWLDSLCVRVCVICYVRAV